MVNIVRYCLPVNVSPSLVPKRGESGNKAASVCTRVVLATDLQEILCGLAEVQKWGLLLYRYPVRSRAWEENFFFWEWRVQAFTLAPKFYTDHVWGRPRQRVDTCENKIKVFWMSMINRCVKLANIRVGGKGQKYILLSTCSRSAICDRESERQLCLHGAVIYAVHLL